MPGYSESASLANQILGGINALPTIAGLQPNQYIAIALIAAVFARFLWGSPVGRDR
ncbi:MAG: hypothetical protein KatS3mg118_0483 [Paracoccaceae bacterium]|nr:MAG: hypothetical protein KatS3mg118_0483 [Paracoccaceae bacterium]